jgi:tetratricopeptide (TPR) repeat protein
MVENRVGAPVRGADFYGREAFVKHVSERLRTGHVLLAAPRRFGKTSVRYRLIDEPQWDYRIVHADLEYMTEPAAFVSELILKLAQDSKLAKALSKLSYAPKELWERIRANIEEVELYEVKVKLKEKISPSWQESGEELFRRVAESKTTVVFFLDEFPMMIDRMARSEKYREEAKTLLRWLRALRHQPGCRNVRFLIAGSIGIGRVLDELGEIAAINDFEPIRLDPFPPKVAAAFLRELATSNELIRVIGPENFSAEALIRLCEAKVIKEGDYRTAALKSSVDSLPKSIEEHFISLVLLLKAAERNDPESMLAYVAQLIKTAPELQRLRPEKSTPIRMGDLWYLKGKLLLNGGKYSEALDSFDKAVKESPKLADAWKSRGQALFGLQRYAQALIVTT